MINRSFKSIRLVAECVVFCWRKIVKFFWKNNNNYASISNENNVKLVITENSKVSLIGMAWVLYRSLKKRLISYV